MYQDENENQSFEICEANQEALSCDDVIELTDEHGNPILLQVVRYFFYNTEEYVVLSQAPKNATMSSQGEETEYYIMKVSIELEDGEEVEVFSPIEDDSLYDALMEVAFAKFSME